MFSESSRADGQTSMYIAQKDHKFRAEKLPRDDLRTGDLSTGNWVEFHAPRGAKGATGGRGIQGIQGLKGGRGPTGLQGIAGERGAPGKRGVAGPKGDRGENGKAGKQGRRGEKGQTGAQGIQGRTGTQGLQGIKGEKGEKGNGGTGLTLKPFKKGNTYHYGDYVLRNHPTVQVKITTPCGSPKKLSLLRKQNHTMT